MMASNNTEHIVVVTKKRKVDKDSLLEAKFVNFQEENEFQFSKHTTLDDIRELQNTFARERNWDQFHQPRNLLLAMVGEVGEVSEIFQWKGEVKEGLPDWTEKDIKHLEQELSDVLIYLVRLAEKCHVDLPKAAIEKIELNKLKYPINKVYGSNKKYTEYQ